MANTIAIAQTSISTLAPLAVSENPKVKREITASMYRASRLIWLANSPRYLDLLARYNALALLLPSGRYLMVPETASNALALIRSATHEDNEILMQQEEKLHPTRYNRLMLQILGSDDIMKLYRVLSHYKEFDKQPNNIIFNDLIATAFEILSIIDDYLVYPNTELINEEREFIALMRPILQAKDSKGRYKNFSQVFFDTDKRTKAIKALQENKDERFYRVASTESPVLGFLDSIIATIAENWQGFFKKRISPDFIEFFDRHNELRTRIPVIFAALNAIGDSLSNQLKDRVGKQYVGQHTERMDFYEWISFRVLEYDVPPAVLVNGSQKEIESWLRQDFSLMPIDGYDQHYRTYSKDGKPSIYWMSASSYETLDEFCRISGVDPKDKKAKDEFLAKFFNGDRRGLELGPGWDYHICLDLRRQYLADLVACETNFRALRVARQDYGVPIKRGSVLELPFAANTFDYMIGISVLPYAFERGKSQGQDFRGFDEYPYLNADRIASELYRVAKQGCVQLYYFRVMGETEDLYKYFEDAGRYSNGDGGGLEVISNPSDIGLYYLFVRKVDHPLMYEGKPFWQIEENPEKNFDLLIKSLLDPAAKWTAKLRAIKVLKKLKNPIAIGALVKLACDESQCELIRRHALDAIGDINKEAAQEAYLSTFLDESVPADTRVRALSNRFYLTDKIAKEEKVLENLVKLAKSEKGSQSAIAFIGHLSENAALLELDKLYDWVKGLQVLDGQRAHFLFIGIITALKILNTDKAIGFIERVALDPSLTARSSFYQDSAKDLIPWDLSYMKTPRSLQALQRIAKEAPEDWLRERARNEIDGLLGRRRQDNEVVKTYIVEEMNAIVPSGKMSDEELRRIVATWLSERTDKAAKDKAMSILAEENIQCKSLKHETPPKGASSNLLLYMFGYRNGMPVQAEPIGKNNAAMPEDMAKQRGGNDSLPNIYRELAPLERAGLVEGDKGNPRYLPDWVLKLNPEEIIRQNPELEQPALYKNVDALGAVAERIKQMSAIHAVPSINEVQQAFSALDSEARKVSQLGSSVSKLRGTSQNLIEVNKFRFCLPIEVLRNSPDIALALNSTGLLKQKPQDAENIEFELVVTGVTEEDIKLIDGLNRDNIKKALNLPKRFTVSTITEAQIQKTAQRFGYDASNPKNRVAIVKDFFSGALAKGEYMAIATDALDGAEKADALKEELERELKAELAEENISIRVLVRPESGKSVYSLSKIINDWLEAINQGNLSTISKILPIPAPLTPELERAIKTAWAVLTAA